jgi:hypothetical protein
MTAAEFVKNLKDAAPTIEQLQNAELPKELIKEIIDSFNIQPRAKQGSTFKDEA